MATSIVSLLEAISDILAAGTRATLDSLLTFGIVGAVGVLVAMLGVMRLTVWYLSQEGMN
jgi:hypothetical protein